MYTPLLPGSSLSAWQYLQDSRSEQLQAFSRDGIMQRERSHFAEAIVNMSSVEDLMSDYQALKVALGAHGLQEDLPNRFFVRQVIEQGTGTEDAFANRLSDVRYTSLAQTFEELGLTGEGVLSSDVPTLSDDIATAITDQFGESPIYLNAAARISGGLSLGILAADPPTNVWERALEDPALENTVFNILGLHNNAAGLSQSAQVGLVQDATEFQFGGRSLTDLIDPESIFDVADQALGTAGVSLDTAFSYTALAERVSDIDTANSSETDKWAALQADTTLRDILAQVVGVSAGFSALSAADQITELQSGTEDLFGRSDFEVFGVQANQTMIGDSYLDPDGAGLDHAFSIGGFTDRVTTVREQGASVDEKWLSVLQVTEVKDVLVETLGLEGFDDQNQLAQLITIQAATEELFGSKDVTVLQEADNMARLTGLYMDKQIDAISQNYAEQEFRVAVGDLRPELRVALSVAEELQLAVDTGGTDNGQWFRVLGSSVLRTAFEGAYGLPQDFGQVDLDGQVSTMRSLSEDLIGSGNVADFLEPENMDALINQYLSRAGTADTSAAGSDPTVGLFTTASASTILAAYYGN